MLRVLGSGSLLLVVALLAPSGAQGQNKKKQKDVVPMATEQDYSHLAQLKDVTGKLVYAESSARSITLRIDYQHYETNPNFKPGKGNNNIHREMQRIVHEQNRIATSRNPVQQQQALLRLNQDMARLQNQLVTAGSNPNNLPYKLVSENKDFDLELVDKVVVRWKNPPFKYDDKGNVIKYTTQQLEEMKGKDKTKPGYEAKFEDLTPGQTVKLYLRAPEKKSSSSKDAKEDQDSTASAKPKVTMIVITQDSDDPTFGQSKDQGKKKKNK